MSSFSTMNKAMLIGRLGQDPELKHTTGGTAVCNFSVATDSSYKQNDSWEEKTEWHRVVVFGSLAETVAKYLKKGSTCFIEGRLQTRKYQDRDGNERSTTEVVAQTVKFLDSRSSAPSQDRQYSQPAPAAATPKPTPQAAPAAPVESPSIGPVGDDDENLPF
ncbi:single-stranded DNA-binding protein [bacterium]|nr:single-stranded DNA-binding protein [bacterium]